MSSDQIRQLRRDNQGLQVPKGEERWLSGYSDASYAPTGGGWGIWVRDSNTRILRAAPCPPWVRSSNDAELCGVYAAIVSACRDLEADWANILVVKTDSQTVASWFGWNRSQGLPAGEEQRKLMLRAYEWVQSKQIRLVVTWVKGHQGQRTTTGYLNDRVDQLAGQARKSGRKFSYRCPIGGESAILAQQPEEPDAVEGGGHVSHLQPGGLHEQVVQADPRAELLGLREACVQAVPEPPAAAATMG